MFDLPPKPMAPSFTQWALSSLCVILISLDLNQPQTYVLFSNLH